MRPLALLLLAMPAAAPGDPFEPVRKAVQETAGTSYAYRVKGRYERSGEYRPGDILTSRIRLYQSARHGSLILVKGPEGLWKEPRERRGEKTERPDPEAAEIIPILQSAEPPHRMAEEILKLARRCSDPEEAESDGVACRRYRLTFDPGAIRPALAERMRKSIRSGDLAEPGEIRWNTLKGGAWVFVGRKDGLLVRVKDERSVQTVYKLAGAPEVRTYKNEMEYSLSDWGKAEIALPPEVKERLKIED